MENNDGRIDTNYRRFYLTAKQAFEKYGEALPDKIIKSASKEPSKKFEFVHFVGPNPDYIEGSLNPAEFKFKSYHVSCEDEKIISEGGFRTFPFLVSRYVTAPNETYGRGPAMAALAEIKMLNAMRKTDLKARHMAVDPPHLAADEQSIRRLNLKPNHINYGTLDAAGNQLVKPYQNASRIDLSNDMINQGREFINDTFLVTLFQILVETPSMTATEVLQRAQEKGALLAPTMGRQQSEFLGPLIERELDILSFSGLLPEMPEQLQEAGGEFEIEYTSPLSRMQKAEEAVSAQRLIETALPLVQIDPNILDNFNLDEYVSILADASMVPNKMLRSDDEKQQIREARAQQQQLQQMAESAPDIAGSIKDIAQAQEISK